MAEYTPTVHDIEAVGIIDSANRAQLQEICGTLYLALASRLISYEGRDLPLLLMMQASGIYGQRSPEEVPQSIRRALGFPPDHANQR